MLFSLLIGQIWDPQPQDLTTHTVLRCSEAKVAVRSEVDLHTNLLQLQQQQHEALLVPVISPTTRELAMRKKAKSCAKEAGSRTLASRCGSSNEATALSVTLQATYALLKKLKRISSHQEGTLRKWERIWLTWRDWIRSWEIWVERQLSQKVSTMDSSRYIL